MEKTLSAPITSLVSDRYGHQIAVSTSDGKISFFSAQNLAQIGSVDIKEATPNCLSFSANDFGPLLAAGLSNGKILLFSKCRQVSTILGHKATITGIAFHPTENIIATSSLDGTFGIHTFSDGKWNSIFTPASKFGTTAIAWGSDSADSKVIQTVFVGSVEGTVSVFLSSPGSNSWELGPIAQVQNSWIRKLAAPSSVNAGVQKVASVGDDSTANIVKFETDKLTVLSTGLLAVLPTGVSWAMVDQTLVVSHIDGTTTMWKEDPNGNLVQMQ